MPQAITYVVETVTETAFILDTRVFTASTTIGAGSVYLVDATTGPITVTLPAAADIESRVIVVKKIDSSVNAVTIDGDGAETIDGATTQTLSTQYDSMIIISNGSSWHII